MIKYYIIVLLLTILGSFGAFFLKKATNSKPSIMSAFTSKYLYIGGALYILAAILNIFVLNYLDYIVLLPLTSLSYIWTMIIARIFLGDKISRNKKIGVLCICIGAFIIAM